MSGLPDAGAIVTMLRVVRRPGMQPMTPVAPAPAANPSSPGPFIVLGLPIALQLVAMFVLVGIDTPLRPWVLRTMDRPAGALLLSAMGFGVVVVVMIVVMSWIEWRQKRVQRPAR
jgi:hypothetical protein